MHLFLGQAAEVIGDILVGYSGCLLKRQPFDHLRQGGGGGDGAGAAEGFELGINNFIFGGVKLEGEFQGIAAGQGTNLADPVRFFDLPDVARIQEVLFDFIRIIPHSSNSLSPDSKVIVINRLKFDTKKTELIENEHSDLPRKKQQIYGSGG